MSDRLTANDWIDFALKALAREGADVLKADVLARKLGVSRGSFYWHFEDLGAFHVRVIDHWKQVATEAIIAEVARHPAPAEQLVALLRRAFGTSAGRLEVRMRAWADTNAKAAAALAQVDTKRQSTIERMLVEAGIAPALAQTRALLLYWAYLGAAASQRAQSGPEFERMITELSAVGLGEAAPKRRRASDAK